MKQYQVAPHAGAWIEIRKVIVSLTKPTVAPHAGAWIEINNKTRVAPRTGAQI